MMSSDDSDAGPERKRKRYVPPLLRIMDSSGSSSTSGSPILGEGSSRTRPRRQVRRNNLIDSDSSSDSSSSIVQTKRKRVMKVESDSEDESSDSSLVKRSGRPRRLSSDSDSDGSCSSQWETDDETVLNLTEQSDVAGPSSYDNKNSTGNYSDTSDCDSEKCPICLLTFRKQKIGTPEGCDHVFCLQCIQEWSKNMNTCPVDRQEYSLILVRSSINGKVVRRIEVQKPVPQNDVDIEEEPTFCEICGNSNLEDRMLLCDRCDLGFHMHCLNPPLTQVPIGNWYCNDCAPLAMNAMNPMNPPRSDFTVYELLFYRPTEGETARNTSQSMRLIPRTRYNERVIRRIASNRQQNSRNLGEEESEEEYLPPADNTEIVSSSTSRRGTRKKKSKRKKSRRLLQYKIVYEIDKTTGEAVPVKKQLKRKSRRRNRRRRDTNSSRPRTVKTRLARQLGICAPSAVPQNLPDVRIPNPPSSINGLRTQVGIPTLHIFGPNNELDYFSGSEEEYSSNSQVLARRANISDVSIMRRVMRRKAAITVPGSAVSSSTDVLGRILSSQEQFHSKNATYSLDSSGKFKVEMKSGNNNSGYIDLNKEKASHKETPNNYPNNNRNQNYNNRYQYYPNSYNRRRSQGGNYNPNYSYNSAASSSWHGGMPGQSNDFYNRYGGNEDNDYPQDYTQRTLCASNDPENERDDRENENEAAPNSESEIDIYSDIETVTTSKAEESENRPLSPPPVFAQLPMPGADDDNNDSEPDMVIDDEKVHEENREESTVTSTVDNSRDLIRNISSQPFNQYEPRPSHLAYSSNTNFQSEPVASSSFVDTIGQYDDDSNEGCPNTSIYNKRNYDTHNDNDDDEDEGCPNFSIYSKESKTVALHTDLSVPPPPLPTGYQIGEVTSSPPVVQTSSALSEAYDPAEPSCDEPVTNEADLYDPEAAVLEQSPVPSPANSGHNSGLQDSEAVSKIDDRNVDDNKSPDQKVNSSSLSEEGNQAVMCESAISEEVDKDLAEDATTGKHGDCQQPVEHIPEPVVEHGDKTDEKLDKNPEVSSNSRENTPEPMDTESAPENLESPNLSMAITDRSLDLDETGVSTPRIKVSVKSKVEVIKPQIKGGVLGGLYSDSEDECLVKVDNTGALEMTEDISEEERSYTPCLDEKKDKQGLEGLDTELISDEDRNDFDETQEHKTGSDGDALEINAKELELELRPEDYEEGEIVDKNKVSKPEDNQEEPTKTETKKSKPKKDGKDSKKSKKKDKAKTDEDKIGNKENEKAESFKKISRSNKERNYRDKDKSPSFSKSKEIVDTSKKEKKKEKRKELERYNVRAVIAEKPRPLIIKDQFGRDIRPTPSRSRSRSYTPPVQPPRRRSLSLSRNRSPSPVSYTRNRSRSPHRSRSRQLSPVRERPRKRRTSRNFRSLSRSKSPEKKRSRSKNKKRKRSPARREKRKSSDRVKAKKKPRRRSRSRPRHRSLSQPRRHAEIEWNRRDWSPLLSLSPARQEMLMMSPSWTPPRELNTEPVLRNPNLQITLNNANKKKKERRKKDKRTKETTNKRRRRLDRLERTPPPSKEVFASGDNILVSVSFNNVNETRDVTTREKRNVDNQKKKRKKRTKPIRDLSGVKPVAIIDLARSPFRELTPSPKNVIVLSDSDPDNDNTNNVEKNVCDSSHQVASPEHAMSYAMGPKTPPEPQIKFSLAVKPPQIRAISNPLHEPEDMENNEDEVQQELENRLNEGLHKGPNTPPEPPISPPSSPDAYDPFEPTKSRSPTPEPMQTLQSTTNILSSNDSNENNIDSRSDLDKPMNPPMDSNKSLTPPLLDVQPADSQSSIQVTPESTMGKSPDRIGAISQSLQTGIKPIAQTTPFSSVPTSIINSAPSANQAPSRINIINSTVIPAPIIASSIPQRIVLPNQVKSSPVKIPPTKATVKSTPIKPMPNKSKSNLAAKRQQITTITDEPVVLDDSPYSPGSSDYDDLFEPPSDIVTKPVIKGKNKSQKQHLSTFDTLFGSPAYKPSRAGKVKYKKGTKTKMVGVKLDEDCLKILDELPNSAVEMQVKDKFLKKLNRQERVVEEVKLVLKPHYNKKRLSKEEYKEIMRRAVPKICHNKSGEINPTKIKNLVEAYVKKIRHSKKVTSSSSVNNPIKV